MPSYPPRTYSKTADEAKPAQQPGDIFEIIALGSAVKHTAAAMRLRDCGFPPEVLFDDDVALALVRLLLYGEEPRFDAVEARRAAVWLDWADWNAWRRPDWACRAVEQLVELRAGRLVEPTLRWAADAIAFNWTTLDRVEQIVRHTLALAQRSAA